MSGPKEYTVGWICAQKAFLDEKHEEPDPLPSEDNNQYACGRMGKHKVVIAVLPIGEYGVSSAASVARNMLRSFPNIRIGLLVGIGGGAPSFKHDVHLVDIVVRAPGEGNFGKVIHGQPFQATGFLKQPPIVLRTALSGLKSHYESLGHRLKEAVNRVIESNPRLRKKYKRPEPASDKLHRSDFILLLNHQASCAVICVDDLSRLVMGKERAADEDNPASHFGKIASADQLMRDALVRDQIATENGVLCFEMEAAGLMNHFPCLVIRGICDYADSHKNKEWQGYSAIVAAAYAQDLLSRVAPSRIEKEKRSAEVLYGNMKLIDWLTQNDYGPQQSDNFGRRQPGTEKWLLQSTEYEAWREADTNTPLCTGIPEVGKTIQDRIKGEDLDASKLAMDVLMWITCSKRQLYSWELQEALEIELGTVRMDKDNILQIKDIISVCAGLVEFDEKSDIIRFVYETAREYFERNMNKWFPSAFPSAELHLTITCVTDLSFETFGTGFCMSDEQFESQFLQNPLFIYAARNWG
ncbi:ankyrin [Penicillium malachiteum]|nr:ankyrin [Penicillium malachiteum]